MITRPSEAAFSPRYLISFPTIVEVVATAEPPNRSSRRVIILGTRENYE
jgi:hypothetical protein